MAFADVNADKYTDMLTVRDQGSEIQLHLFDPFYKKFVHSGNIEVSGCSSIYNIVVGRSVKHLRLFVTCSGGSGTIVRFVDRIDGSSEAGIQDYRWEIDSNAINIAADT